MDSCLDTNPGVEGVGGDTPECEGGDCSVEARSEETTEMVLKIEGLQQSQTGAYKQQTELGGSPYTTGWYRVTGHVSPALGA